VRIVKSDGAGFDVGAANDLGEGRFPGYVGLRFTEVSAGRVCAELDVEPHHLAPNGYLHAAVVVTIADTACGYGVRTILPPGAVGFTTIELKSNFLGTALDGTIACEATIVHGGRTTQVWDATVAAGERTIALFRCTQLVLYPKE
jgi:1,4-dihydroxy-2-naphthoyl-CoA hydrolase